MTLHNFSVEAHNDSGSAQVRPRFDSGSTFGQDVDSMDSIQTEIYNLVGAT